MAILSRQLPPLGTLVVFEAAYRLRNFSRAGDEVALSQASVSRQIRQLEANLGVKLFDRRRHDVIPTAEGEALAATVHLTLRELAATAGRIRASSDQKSFTIFSDISIASYMITPVLSEFQQRHPDLQLRVLSSYDPIEMVTDNFDIAFQVGDSKDERFHTEAIADDIIFPVCSPDFASHLPTTITVDELLNYPLLHLEDLGRGWPDWQQFLTSHQVENHPPIAGLTFNSYQVCLDVAERGEGIALGWARSVQSKIDEGKLVRLPDMAMMLPNSIYTYRSILAKPNAITDEFINMVRTHIQPVNL